MSHGAQDYVGSYRLLNLVRVGKTCQIWEVMNDLTNQRRAIKLLLTEYYENKEEVGYLRHEHQVGCNLHHPRVIQIFDYGRQGESIFLAMEYFNAPNLKQALQQWPEKLAVLLPQVIRQAAEGLAYFHTHNWVHRDIKPDNYLVSMAGEVKLIDFALAHRKAGALGRLFSRTSKIQGTRSYMSPEQIRGKPLDQRADIYSFGCMMFEVVGGKLPFTGVSTNDLLNKHLKSPPPPLQSVNRNVTENFAQLVKRCMSKLPQGRPATMDELLLELHGMSIFKEPPAAARTAAS